jgi:PGF-CTERM protein
MSRVLVAALTTAVIVAVVAPGAIGGAAADDVTLEVTIVDSDGAALSDVLVTATWNGGEGGPINRTTAPNGRALFGVPDGADVEITIRDDRYLRNVPYEVESATDRSEEVPVSLSGRATITVEDANGPVENADVVLFQDGRRVDSRQTNASGVATTDLVERDSYRLRVRKAGYLTNTTDITVGERENDRTVQIRRGSAEVEFSVTDETFKPPRPIENATVDIRNGATLPTLNNGLATTSVAVNREYRVTVTKKGYDSVTETVRVRDQPTRVDVPIRRTDNLSVTAANDRVVIGESTQITVTDEYGERVAGATVTVDGSEIGQTDENGQFRVEIDTAGNTTIGVSDGDLSTSTAVEGFDPDATPSESPTVTPTATATVTPTATPGGNGPGFGVAVTLLALGGALLLARRR